MSSVGASNPQIPTSMSEPLPELIEAIIDNAHDSARHAGAHFTSITEAALGPAKNMCRVASSCTEQK